VTDSHSCPWVPIARFKSVTGSYVIYLHKVLYFLHYFSFPVCDCFYCHWFFQSADTLHYTQLTAGTGRQWSSSDRLWHLVKNAYQISYSAPYLIIWNTKIKRVSRILCGNQSACRTILQRTLSNEDKAIGPWSQSLASIQCRCRGIQALWQFTFYHYILRSVVLLCRRGNKFNPPGSFAYSWHYVSQLY
jgi:hypothetical protein